MSNLIVITFDNMEEANKVRESLRKGQKGDYLSLDDSAVVVKDEEGNAYVQNEMDRGVKGGRDWRRFPGIVDWGFNISCGGTVFRRPGRSACG